jgi:hypothetical protein
MTQDDRRRERRLPLREPAVVRLCDENLREVSTVTENVSTGGVLLRSASLIPGGSKVEVTILLPTGAQIKGTGEVVRAEQKPAGGQVLIAVKCDVSFQISASSSSGAM